MRLGEHHFREVLGAENHYLVSRQVLAARLGMVLSPLVDKLIDQLFADTRYRGAFSEGWVRYWWAPIRDELKFLTTRMLGPKRPYAFK